MGEEAKAKPWLLLPSEMTASPSQSSDIHQPEDVGKSPVAASARRDQLPSPDSIVTQVSTFFRHPHTQKTNRSKLGCPPQANPNIVDPSRQKHNFQLEKK